MSFASITPAQIYATTYSTLLASRMKQGMTEAQARDSASATMEQQLAREINAGRMTQDVASQIRQGFQGAAPRALPTPPAPAPAPTQAAAQPPAAPPPSPVQFPTYSNPRTQAYFDDQLKMNQQYGPAQASKLASEATQRMMQQYPDVYGGSVTQPSAYVAPQQVSAPAVQSGNFSTQKANDYYAQVFQQNVGQYGAQQAAAIAEAATINMQRQEPSVYGEAGWGAPMQGASGDAITPTPSAPPPAPPPAPATGYSTQGLPPMSFVLDRTPDTSVTAPGTIGTAAQAPLPGTGGGTAGQTYGAFGGQTAEQNNAAMSPVTGQMSVGNTVTPPVNSPGATPPTTTYQNTFTLRKGDPFTDPTTGQTLYWDGSTYVTGRNFAASALQNPGSPDLQNLPPALKEEIARSVISSIPGHTTAPTPQEVATVAAVIGTGVAAGQIGSLIANTLPGSVGTAVGNTLGVLTGTGATAGTATGAGAGATTGAVGGAVTDAAVGAGAGGGTVAAGGAVVPAAAAGAAALGAEWWKDPAILALGGTAALGALSAKTAADTQAKAVTDAANIQADAATAAGRLQNEQFNAMMAREKAIYDDQAAMGAPWRDAGRNALAGLNTFEQDNPAFSFSTTGPNADPSYSFRLSEGTKALQNSAAARGGLVSGNTMKALQDYGQQAASQEYQNAFNRYQTERGSKLNRLQSLAGIGQSAVQQAGQAAQNYGNAAQQAGQNYAAGAGNAMMSGANALAAGRQGAADASASGWMGASNSLSNALGQYINYNQSQNFINALRTRK